MSSTWLWSINFSANFYNFVPKFNKISTVGTTVMSTVGIEQALHTQNEFLPTLHDLILETLEAKNSY